MNKEAAKLDAMTTALCELRPELDDVARARIQARLVTALDGANSAARAMWMRRMAWPAALLAAAAAVFVLVRPRPQHVAEPRRPAIVSAARPPAAAPLAAEPLALSVYALAGAAAADLVPSLGQSIDVLDVPAGATARAAIGVRGRLSLVGPARLRVTGLHDERIDLALDRGELAIDYDATHGGELIVATPHAHVRVVGTLFAVRARETETRVGVAHGVVEVTSAEDRTLVEAGQCWHCAGHTTMALSRELRRLLDVHASSLLPPPAEHHLLGVEGSRKRMIARLGSQLLGETPVWALVPIGAVEVSLSEAEPSPRDAPSMHGAARSLDSAATIYARAEECLGLQDRACAQHQLQTLIASFPDSVEAEPALYELGQGAQDCTASVPWLERYLARYPGGRFADGARKRIAACQPAPR